MSLLAETKFGLSLLKQSNVDESYVISPLSISLALALLHAGAEGNTKKQIQKALAEEGIVSTLFSSDTSLVDYYKGLSTDVQKESEVLVRIANRIFLRNGFKVNQSYLDNIGMNYSAKAEVLDFDKGKECKKVVDQFVDEATAGKIKEIAKEEDFEGALTIIVNAIYLDAEWKTFFDTESTSEGDFHVKPGVTKKVFFMYQHDSWDPKAAKHSDCNVLTMDYKDKDYKFSIILPKESTTLDSFRKNLTAKKLQSILNSVRKTWVTVIMPKFKIEVETDLKEMLEKIGITEIFTKDAKLEGIGKGKGNVSQIKHKAFIEVDESGTRVAAVTYECLKQCNMTFPDTFKADRPFLYVLTYKNHIIFTGQFCGY